MNMLLIKAGTVLALLLSVFGAGHHFGAKGVQDDWNADKLVTTTREKDAILAAVTKRDKDHAEQIRHTNEVIEGYANTTQELRNTITADRVAADRQRLRLQIPARDCPATSGQAASPVVADAARGSEEIELPATIESGLRDLAEDADREVGTCYAKLNGLRDWATKQGF